MTVKEKIWTYEDYISGRIPHDVSDIINGKEVKKMPARDLLAWLEMEISYLLRKHLDRRKYLIFVGEVSLMISKYPFTLRGADIVVISRDRWNLKNEIINEPPNLIVEIISTDEDAVYILEKMEDYRRWGTNRQVWVFLKSKKIIILTSEKTEIFSEYDEVELLEGVKFRLSDLLKEVGYEGNS